MLEGIRGTRAAGVGLIVIALGAMWGVSVGADPGGAATQPYAQYNGWSRAGFEAATQPGTQAVVNGKDYTVMADKATGGFTAEVHSTTYATLKWDAVPGISGYTVFFSTKPKILLNSYETVLTMNADTPEWPFNGAEPNTQYYFVVTAQTPSKTIADSRTIVVATGSCKTPAVDGPLVAKDAATTKP